MSRSYKKFPRVKCEKSCRVGKKLANKKVRNYKGHISNGREYKKLFESYDICDYSFTQFIEWEIQDWYKDQSDLVNGIKRWRHLEDITLEEALGQWKKYYKCK